MPVLRFPSVMLLLLLVPLLVGQDDCQPNPPPDTLPRPLALDCTIQGTDFFLPVDFTVQRDRVVLIAGPGFSADVTGSVLLPSEAFCPFVGGGNPPAVDVTSATMSLAINGVSRPVPSQVTLSGSALPISNIDVAAACGGAYGAGVQIDLGPTTVAPWPDGAWTVDFFVEAADLDIGVSVSANGAPALSLPLDCQPQDRSVPPNGTTNDPEDSPRIVVDANSDGTYDRLATAADQIRLNVNGYCVGYPCDDGNECTVDACDFRNFGFCSYTNVVDGTSCDAAGVPGMCSSGVCEQPDLSLWDPPDRDIASVVLAGQDALVGSGSTFELDFYRNPAYDCGLSGKYTFLVIEPRDNPGGEAPLWVYLHGGGIGYYDDQGVYHATGNQTEDTWNHEESLESLRDFRLPIGGGQLLDNTRGRRMAEGYRILSVALCDHDYYSGLGTPYPNNPNPGAEVNGLEATMAAVEYTVANYPTTHVFAHGTSAGSVGAYSLAFSFADVGTPLTGAIMDSGTTTPRYRSIFDAYVGAPGFPHAAGTDPDGWVDKVGFFVNEDLAVLTEAQVSAGFTDVPLLMIGGDVDPFFGGNLAPIAEAVAAGLNNVDWMYGGVRQAVAAQPGSPHQVSILDGAGHVPTHDVSGVGAEASDVVDTFIGDILVANPPQPFIKGLESLLIGHSFFRPVAQGLPFHTTQAAVSVHSQSVVSAGGANGAPEALWNDPVKRAQIQAVLDTGTAELFGMTYSPEYPTTAGYELWIDYALAQNPDTAFFLGLPWPDFPESYPDAASYASFWTTGHDTEWHAFIDTLRGLYPGVEIFCIPYGQAALELRTLFEAGNLPDVTALVSTSPDSIFVDAKGHGHVDGILHDLAELVWLNAIYGVDLTTYGYDSGYITDLKAIAKSIMDGHDPAYNAQLPIAE